MSSHRGHSSTTLVAVAAAAALIALAIARRLPEGQAALQGRRGRGRAGRRAGAEAPPRGLAAVSPAAAAEAEGAADGDFVRPAGPAAMRDAPRQRWDLTDEASDESFPASDPPGNY